MSEPRWHKTSEGPPPDHAFCWGWNGEMVFHVDYRADCYGQQGWFWDSNYWLEYEAVTHWMPIEMPAPPQGAGGEAA